jgi:hypothetical protein
MPVGCYKQMSAIKEGAIMRLKIYRSMQMIHPVERLIHVVVIYYGSEKYVEISSERWGSTIQ